MDAGWKLTDLFLAGQEQGWIELMDYRAYNSVDAQNSRASQLW
jgi:hypothetical protein